jgi:trans-aconitate 2-methyltransferase
VSWDPAQYLKFAQPRLRPAIDLLRRIELEAPAAVYDLGAGAGNVTGLLQQRWPGAQITGVDDSAAMLDQARAAMPEVRWEAADLARWRAPAPADLVYSNAALHWLGDHRTLFPRLMGMLAPGGVLAVQMPRNFDAPTHASATEVALEGPWRDRLQHLVRPAPVAAPAAYYDLLAPHAASLDIWETEYMHVLSGEDPVTEWFKGSWLRQFLDLLSPPERGLFEAQYRARVARAYPRRPDGQTLMPFRRLFLIAQAPG